MLRRVERNRWDRLQTEYQTSRDCLIVPDKMMSANVFPALSAS